MKKALLIFAAATVFVACSKTDKLNDNNVEPQTIGFSKVYIEKNTKAYYTVTDLEKAGNTFGVYGFKTTATAGEQKVFGERTGEDAGVKVTFGSGDNADWTYTPTRYWDKVASSYSFYAYLPHKDQIASNVTSVTFDDNKHLSINGFKQITSQPTMIDLMTDLISKVNMTTGIGQNDVEFTFKHILSNINIRMAISADLKADENDNPVTVNSVTVGAIKMDGSYAYNNSDYAWSLTSPQVTDATTFEAAKTNNKVFDAGELKAIDDNLSNGQTLSSDKVDTDASAVPELTDLLFIPQTVIDDYVINVEYLINTQKYNKTIKLKDFKKTTDDSQLTVWEPGYKYTYVLVIGPTPILFDVAGITGWTDGGTYLYKID